MARYQTNCNGTCNRQQPQLGSVQASVYSQGFAAQASYEPQNFSAVVMPPAQRNSSPGSVNAMLHLPPGAPQVGMEELMKFISVARDGTITFKANLDGNVPGFNYSYVRANGAYSSNMQSHDMYDNMGRFVGDPEGGYVLQSRLNGTSRSVELQMTNNMQAFRIDLGGRAFIINRAEIMAAQARSANNSSASAQGAQVFAAPVQQNDGKDSGSSTGTYYSGAHTRPDSARSPEQRAKLQSGLSAAKNLASMLGAEPETSMAEQLVSTIGRIEARVSPNANGQLPSLPPDTAVRALAQIALLRESARTGLAQDPSELKAALESLARSERFLKQRTPEGTTTNPSTSAPSLIPTPPSSAPAPLGAAAGGPNTSSNPPAALGGATSRPDLGSPPPLLVPSGPMAGATPAPLGGAAGAASSPSTSPAALGGIPGASTAAPGATLAPLGAAAGAAGAASSPSTSAAALGGIPGASTAAPGATLAPLGAAAGAAGAASSSSTSAAALGGIPGASTAGPGATLAPLGGAAGTATAPLGGVMAEDPNQAAGSVANQTGIPFTQAGAPVGSFTTGLATPTAGAATQDSPSPAASQATQEELATKRKARDEQVDAILRVYYDQGVQDTGAFNVAFIGPSGAIQSDHPYANLAASEKLLEALKSLSSKSAGVHEPLRIENDKGTFFCFFANDGSVTIIDRASLAPEASNAYDTFFNEKNSGNFGKWLATQRGNYYDYGPEYTQAFEATKVELDGTIKKVSSREIYDNGAPLEPGWRTFEPLRAMRETAANNTARMLPGAYDLNDIEFSAMNAEADFSRFPKEWIPK